MPARDCEMGFKISSVIEITTDGCTMKHRKHKANHVERPIDNHAQQHAHKHHYKSSAVSDKNRLFHHVQGTNNGVKQEVNVTVNVDQKDDCLTGCFSALTKCFIP